MCEYGNGHWDPQTAEEEKEERYPFDVLEESPKEFLVSQPVLQKGERDRSGSNENDGGGQPDLETVHVEVVHRKLESEKDVIEETDRDRGSDAVCGAWRIVRERGKERGRENLQ